MASPDIQLITPESPADWQDVRIILLEYAASLPVSLDFQGFD
ncbi:GNAT family N-acetyltransferase, partial [Escherichia coli]